MDSPKHNLDLSSAELLALCAKQDHSALHELFRRHEHSVFILMLGMLGNVQDAEDALGEAFVKVWRSAVRFKGDCSVPTWLYKIASNTARDVLRSRQSTRKVEITELCYQNGEPVELPGSKSDNPETLAIAASEHDTILRAMNNLSEEDRLLIVLYHFQECDYEQIAHITKMKPGNLKVRLFRARQRLRILCAGVEREPWEDELRTDTNKPYGLRKGTSERA